MNYKEYKQRREAKKFFNQNNEYHMATLDILKILLTAILVAFILAIFFEKITTEIGISFTLFNVIIGDICGYACLKIAGFGSEKIGIIAAFGYFFGTILGLMMFYYLSLPSFISGFYCFKLILSKISDLFYLCSMIIGMMIAYAIAKN